MQEVFAPPGRYTFDSTDFTPADSIDRMQVRSAVIGVPAQVSIA